MQNPVDWDGMVREMGDITNRHHGTPFASSMICAVLDDLEAREKRRRKAGGKAPDQMALF
jgi:hypothetical protein